MEMIASNRLKNQSTAVLILVQLMVATPTGASIRNVPRLAEEDRRHENEAVLTQLLSMEGRIALDQLPKVHRVELIHVQLMAVLESGAITPNVRFRAAVASRHVPENATTRLLSMAVTNAMNIYQKAKSAQQTHVQLMVV